jgi:hypothetical protein
LLLVESGMSPVKTAAGGYGEALKLQPGDNPFVAAVANDRELPVLGNLGWQASTLGGRQIDVILNGKASFRKGADTVGGIGIEGASYAGSAAIGGALLVVGVATVLISSAAKARADTRHWDNLPDRIYGDFLKPGASSALAIAEKSGDGERYAIPKPVIDATAGRCRVLLYRTREPGTLRAQAVSSLTDGERKSLTKRNEARDTRFRNEMNALFLGNGESLAGGE